MPYALSACIPEKTRDKKYMQQILMEAAHLDLNAALCPRCDVMSDALHEQAHARVIRVVW